MPQGLQVWNASGQLIVDTNSPSGVIIGVHTFNGAAAGAGGSISVPQLALGTPFWVLRGSWFVDPSISVSGTTISWTFTQFVPSSIVYELIYGYF